jgi:hypothetical protein
LRVSFDSVYSGTDTQYHDHYVGSADDIAADHLLSVESSYSKKGIDIDIQFQEIPAD